MAQDIYGNYVVGLEITEPDPLPGSISGGVTPGHGPPDNADGSDDDLYFDEDANALYVKVAGVWTLLISAGSVASVYTGVDEDPNGVVIPTDPASGAVYYQTPTTTPYNFWLWDVGTAAWIQNQSPI